MTSCVNGEGEVVPDSRCTLGRPKTREICDMGSCARGWYYTRWSKDVSAGSVCNERPVAGVRERERGGETKREREREAERRRERKRETDRQRMGGVSDSQWLVRERQRQTDRQTDRQNGWCK